MSITAGVSRFLPRLFATAFLSFRFDTFATVVAVLAAEAGEATSFAICCSNSTIRLRNL